VLHIGYLSLEKFDLGLEWSSFIAGTYYSTFFEEYSRVTKGNNRIVDSLYKYL